MSQIRVHFWGNPDWSSLFSETLGSIAVCTFGEDVPVDVNVLVKGRPDSEELKMPDLHSVVIPFAGIPVQTRELVQGFSKIGLYNLHHNAADTAEMAIALYLAVAKRIVPRDLGLRTGFWSEDTFVRGGSPESVRVAGKTALVFGYGEIGRRIAQICNAMEMRVRAVRRNGPFGESVRPLNELDALLPGTDALFVALPLTPETEGLMDSRRIGLLPKTALIANIARAAIFDEKALFEALKDGQIGGAGLDVWWNYPKFDEACMPANFPFQDLPNVVMTPHVGGSSDASEEHRWRVLAELIRDIAAGTAKPASVELGY